MVLKGVNFDENVTKFFTVLTMVLKEAQRIVLKAWMALLLANLTFLYGARGEVMSRRAASPGGECPVHILGSDEWRVQLCGVLYSGIHCWWKLCRGWGLWLSQWSKVVALAATSQLEALSASNFTVSLNVTLFFCLRFWNESLCGSWSAWWSTQWSTLWAILWSAWWSALRYVLWTTMQST